MKKLILVSIMAVLLVSSCSKSSHSQIKNDVLNFNFETSSTNAFAWKHYSLGGRLIHDSTECISGKYSIRFEPEIFSNSFDISISQYFNLPVKSEWVELSAYSKSEFVQRASLELWFLDIDENILAKDSLLISNCNSWNKFTLKKRVPSAHKIYINIHARSVDSLLAVKQKFWIDNVQLKLNGKDCYDYADTFYIPDSDDIIENSIHINPFTFNELRNIDDFKNHKVLAFGESVHGSLTIQNTVYETIKYLIENDEVKLILFELPFEIGLRINEYILGQTNDSIQEILTGYTYENSGTYDLLNWIKHYNERAERKTMFAGMDSNLSNVFGYHHLWAYLKNQKIHADSLKTLFTLLKQGDIDKAIGFIQSNPYFKTLGNELKNNMHKALEVRLLEKNAKISGYVLRDYIQFQNTMFAIKTWCNDSDKVIIYAHLGHVNKKNIIDATPETSSFGNYMNGVYGNNYFVTALMAGTGEFNSHDSIGNYVISHLQKPIKGSLEIKFLNPFHEISYKNLSDIKSASYARYVGASYLYNQFYPYSHKNRFDALFFIQKSEGFSISNFWKKTVRERVEYIRKLRKLDSY